MSDVQNKAHLFTALQELTHTLRTISEIGWQGFDCTEKSLELIQNWGKQQPDLSDSIKRIRFDIEDCRRCTLSKHRKNIVFGSGNEAAGLLFIDGWPGTMEDELGILLAGEAGELFTRIVQAMQLSREDVYVCSVIKCHPPRDRDPQSNEVKTCKLFLERQIDAIKPDLICTLGPFAAAHVISKDRLFSEIRGRFHSYRGIPVMPTHHPAYLLQYPEKKRDVWEDIKKVMRALGLKPI